MAFNFREHSLFRVRKTDGHDTIGVMVAHESPTQWPSNVTLKIPRFMVVVLELCWRVIWNQIPTQTSSPTSSGIGSERLAILQKWFRKMRI